MEGVVELSLRELGPIRDLQLRVYERERVRGEFACETICLSYAIHCDAYLLGNLDTAECLEAILYIHIVVICMHPFDDDEAKVTLPAPRPPRFSSTLFSHTRTFLTRVNPRSPPSSCSSNGPLHDAYSIRCLTASLYPGHE